MTEKWYIEVAILGTEARPTRWAMGPVHSWSRAREIAHRWEREHGPDTTKLRAR